MLKENEKVTQPKDPVRVGYDFIGWYSDTMNKWGRYFFDGRFTVIDRSELPWWVKRSEWLSADGRKVLRILYNASSSPVEVMGLKLGADEMRFDEFDIDKYGK